MQLKIWLESESEQVRLHLMEGLDQWVALGLLTDKQVREIAATLSEPLPAVSVSEPLDSAIAPDAFRWNKPATVTPFSGFPPSQSEEALQPKKRTTTLATKPKPSLISRAIASLIEELSVMWLLFLGVFLVVVSSGVLAASQWSSFSVVGQYAILFAYTLAFWVASIWAQKRENLQNTGRMLALTTLLLLPVNFWMMDRFGVLSSPVGMGVGGISALVLTGMPLGLSSTLMPRRTNRLNLLVLSWLH
ncbi:MAG: hypothetical protein AAFU53_19655 [Cyanobacteria bacterium J06632_3]